MNWKTRTAPGSHSLGDAEDSLEELAQLAAGAGAVIASRSIQNRPAPEAATLIGQGKVEELAAAVKSESAGLVIFDHDLSPTQQRNLEKAIDARIITRTQLILDIFAARAHTREGSLQVELAQLSYLLPRLTGRGIEMSRLGGGIGTRGPGETQLETDRRKIGKRIKKLKDDLESVRTGRALHRNRRTSVPLATLALAGYTNAGKSSLFNRLTKSNVMADARMFATLDPTVRPLDLPSRRRVLFSDTVGFIRNLPPALVKAFRATLEEVTESTLILHVVDASAPEARARTEQVEAVLTEIGAHEIPRILVLNKIDRLPPDVSPESVSRQITNNDNTPAIAVSAVTGQGIPELLAEIDRVLPLDPLVRVHFSLPPGGGPTLAMLHQFGRVLETRFEPDRCEVEAEIPESLERRLKSPKN